MDARKQGMESVALNPLEWHPTSYIPIGLGIILLAAQLFIPWSKVWHSVTGINPITWTWHWPLWFELWFRDKRVQLVNVKPEMNYTFQILTITFEPRGIVAYNLNCISIRDGSRWLKADDTKITVSDNLPKEIQFHFPLGAKDRKVKTRIRARLFDKYVYSDKFEIDLDKVELLISLRS